VNGVGPKVALAIVSGSPADELRRAIVREDTARFQAIPGIGKKTAERIVLELKEKLAASVSIAPVGDGDADDHVVARDALVELGYSLTDAERALSQTDSSATPEERVRQALRKAA
jgi:holliday junction DNA helicase RuvA